MEREREERKIAEQRAREISAATTIVRAGPEALGNDPQGEAIIRSAIAKFQGPEGVAEELLILYRTTTSSSVKRDILKLLIMGSLEIERNRPKAELGGLSNEDLQKLIDDQRNKIIDAAFRRFERGGLAPKLTHEPEPTTDDDPGLQPGTG